MKPMRKRSVPLPFFGIIVTRMVVLVLTLVCISRAVHQKDGKGSKNVGELHLVGRMIECFVGLQSVLK